MSKRIILIPLIVLMLAAGCQTTKKPTQKEVATKQWNAARGAVLYSLAKDQYATGNFDKCRQSLTDAIKMEPTNAAIRVLSAKVAIEQGQLEMAEKELAVARESDPKNAEADYLSGVICQRWQKATEAYNYYTTASEKAPAELAYIMARSEMLVVMDRPAEALQILQEKVVYFEHSAAIRDAVGQLLVQQGKYDDAATVLKQASILATDDLTIQEHLGLALFYNHKYRDAAEVLSRLVKQDEFATRADLLTVLGECQLQDGNAREARRNFETAAQHCPGSASIWLSLGKASILLNDMDRSDLSLRKALALDPVSAEANLMLGYVRLRQSRLPEALIAFRKANTMDNHDTVSLCMIGYVMERNGKAAQAMQYYAAALKIDPSDELATHLMASVAASE